MDKPLIVFIDMDDTIADFIGSQRLNLVGLTPETMPYPHEMHERGFFRALKPIEGAIEAVRQLHQCPHFEIHILSKPVHLSPHSYSEKIEWIHEHLPELTQRITLTQRKELCLGDFLVDDSLEWKDPWEKSTGGTFIHFNPRKNRISQWQSIVAHLLSQTEQKG